MQGHAVGGEAELSHTIAMLLQLNALGFRVVFRNNYLDVYWLLRCAPPQTFVYCRASPAVVLTLVSL